MISNEDMKQIADEMALLFVTRKECATTTEDIKQKLSVDTTRLAVIEQRLTINNWLTTAIIGGLIAALIKLFIG